MKPVELHSRYSLRISFFLIYILISGPYELSAQKKRKIDWMSFEQLDDSLAIQKKKVWISFYADWCVYCKKMDASAYTKPDIAAILNTNFYPVKMDAETLDSITFDGQVFINKNTDRRNGRIHELALLLGSREAYPFSLPVTLLLDEDFKVIERHFNYLSPKEMRNILERYMK